MVGSASRLPWKLLRAFGIAAAGVAAVLLLGAGWFAQVHFLAWQDHVEARLSALAPGEADLPPMVADVIRTIEGDRMSVPVARALVAETHGNQMRHLEWHALNALWAVLLPVTRDERELTALYGSVMYFGGGYGLTYGAKHHFGKMPAELSREEMIGLFVISWNPAISPESDPERYRQQLARFEEIHISRKSRPGAQR